MYAWRPSLQLAVALLIPVLVLSALAAGAGVFRADIEIARFLQRFPDPPFRWIADSGNLAGSSGAGVPLTIAVVIALLLRRHAGPAAITALATLARLLNDPLKRLLDSPRPTGEHVRITELAEGLGFPSGHAMGATLTYGAVIVVAERLIRPAWPRRLVQGAALAIILMTGFGRIYTGAHWPSDVLGGYLWGVILLVAIVVLVDRLLRPRTGSPVYSRDEATSRDE